MPGTYSVKISGLGEESVSLSADRCAEAEPLPERFHEKSRIEVVIPHGGTCHLSFDLKR